MQIWKYTLHTTRSQKIIVPKGANIINIDTQMDTPCLWAEVDASDLDSTPRGLDFSSSIPAGSPMEAPSGYEKIPIYIFPTGSDFSKEGLEFIGTYMTAEDHYVWHVYYKKNN